MFDLGNNDKEKLEENMEEIKELVSENSQETSSREENHSTENKELFDNLEQELGDENLTNEPVKQNKQNIEDFNNNSNQKDNEGENKENKEKKKEKHNDEFKQMQQELEEEIKTIEDSKNNTNSKRQPQQERSIPSTQESDSIQKETDTGNKMSSKGDSRSTRDKQIKDVSEENISSGKTENNAIFLDVENFDEVKKMVQEMEYLTRELGDVVSHLETGIEEDNKTVKESDEIIQEFQARREKIQTTLKDK